MRIKPTLFLSLLTLLLALFSGTIVRAQSVTLAVEFGTMSGSGVCVGNGVCECSPPANSPGGINVQFAATPDQTAVILTFSLSDLKNSQPDQVANFGSGSYIFSVAYALSDPMFAPLNLPTNAQITPNSNSTVTISGDVVTDYITLYYAD